MNRTICILAIAGFLMTVGSVARAGSVVILPTVYGQGSVEASMNGTKVDAAVETAVVEAGFSVLKGPAVKDALDAMKRQPADCDASCLRELAQRMNADEAIAVRAFDDEQVIYTVDVTFARREPIHEERTAGFFVVLEWLKGAVSLSLKGAPSEQITSPDGANGASPAAAAAGTSVESGEQNSETGQAATHNSKEENRKKINKTPFIATAALTGTLLVTFLILDGVVNKQYNEISDKQSMSATGEMYYDEINQAESIQSAEKVVLGLTIAAAVATGVLAIFTDFKGEKVTPPAQGVSSQVFRWRPVATVSENGGGVGVLGSF